MKKCTQPRHKWTWKKDKTLKSLTFGGHMTIARKGVYQCDHCAELKYGEARTGFPPAPEGG